MAELAPRERERAGLLLVLLLLILPSAGPATAVAGELSEGRRPLPVPGAFRLQASNGYTLDVIGIPGRGVEPGAILVVASAEGKGVTYQVPAVVGETGMRADLGALGRVAVTFRRSGEATSVRCGGRSVRFDSGVYEGTIDFHGEEGYTAVEATKVEGNIDYVCAGGYFEEASGGRPVGAELYVRNPALGQEMAVRRRSDRGLAEIAAWVAEYRDQIAIKRFSTLRIPGASFVFDRRLRTATVRPPAPFTGSARFDLGRKAGRRWSGDLTVDLPGKADVPLTGPALRAYLTPI